MTNDLVERLTADRDKARLEKNSELILVLNSALGDLINAKIKNGGKDLKEDAANEVVYKAVRQRRNSAAEYDKVGSTDRRDIELREAEILSAYIPAEVSEENLAKTVDTVIGDRTGLTMKDMGSIIGQSIGRLKKTGLLIDKEKLSGIVKSRILGK